MNVWYRALLQIRQRDEAPHALFNTKTTYPFYESEQFYTHTHTITYWLPVIQQFYLCVCEANIINGRVCVYRRVERFTHIWKSANTIRA